MRSPTSVGPEARTTKALTVPAVLVGTPMAASVIACVSASLASTWAEKTFKPDDIMSPASDEEEAFLHADVAGLAQPS